MLSLSDHRTVGLLDCWTVELSDYLTSCLSVPPIACQVYELMDTDLHQIIRSAQALSNEHLQYFTYQVCVSAGVHVQAGICNHPVTKVWGNEHLQYCTYQVYASAMSHVQAGICNHPVTQVWGNEHSQYCTYQV